MTNLRLLEIKVVDSTTIEAKFTEPLDTLINPANVNIVSNILGNPDPKVLIVDVVDDVLIITCQPMTPYAAYFITFKSTDTFKFKSTHGSFLFEDNVTNVVLILGAEEPNNSVRDFLIGYQKDNVYNFNNKTLVRDVINSQADNISRGLYDIRQAKNDNYLGFIVQDEIKTRGAGPFDRLDEEGAYEIIRVGKDKSFEATLDTSLSFSDGIPDGPITLLSVTIINEKLIAGAGNSTFDGLILTVTNAFVTKLKKVTIAYQVGTSATYDLDKYGYQILEPRYDRDLASPFFLLFNNQFKLSDAALGDGFVPPSVGDFVMVDYEYQQKGRVVDATTVVVSQVLQAIREVTPPILTEFTLRHSPIVSANDNIVTIAGVQFLDPNSNPPFSGIHPAFSKEIPFRFDGLPTRSGEYSIDYTTGRVFCYGGTVDLNDGTGDFPPVASYFYRQVFVSGLDYTYDSDSSELVANPERDLIGKIAKISFSYESVLVPDVDYIAQIHQEVLDERIENRLLSTNSIGVKNFPVTNVFRIYNETSGELYRIQRWNNSIVYFTFSTPPNIQDQKGERVSFQFVTNELLIVLEEIINIQNVRVYRIFLQNNRIISASEDAIGASFNSSATFSRTDIFSNELYFDNQLSNSNNYDRLSNGYYQIDYQNGIIYVGVEHAQNFDLGTINYKRSVISPINSHVISVSEIYHSIDNISGINKRISYDTFGEGFVQPSTFDSVNERFLNGDVTQPYVVDSNTITVMDDIKDVRGIYDVYDLNNNIIPTNFVDGAEVSANVITLGSEGVQKQEILTVLFGNIINATFITSGAQIISVTSVIRLSDQMDLWATPGTFVNYQITLSGVNSPAPGNIVVVIYNLVLNGAATPVVDYNRGDYFMDYSYLADEILVSYEHGDNQLDHRQSNALNTGEQYFVTYRVGALRQALLQNFGTLVNLPILNTLDTSFPRENYRDALRAALQSFTKGPTIPAMKSIVSNITHIEPELIESAFQSWSLGLSRLYFADIKTTGNLQLMSGKYDLGVLIDQPGQTITFPVSSNLRLEEGTLEMWVIPEWNGLDNDASLTFQINLDGYVLPVTQIYIGADSHNPIYDVDNKFTINRADSVSPIGLPSAIFTNVGMFIFYDDVAARWKVYAKDSVFKTEGSHYTGTIESSGEVYDVKFIPDLGELDDILRSSTNKIEFEFNINNSDAMRPDGYVDGYDGYNDGYDGYVDGYSFDGIHFMADEEHYLFDFGNQPTQNRFSIFKDGKGYLNFRIYDKGNVRANQYKISSDISNWKAGQKHYIATSWRLNSSDRRDEIHLFIDGFEIPNIMRYGGRPIGTSVDRFRTVKPEYIVGNITKNVIAGNDMSTIAGSNIVTSSVNFQSNGIIAGDTLTINELGFGSYVILTVNNFELTLNSTTPSTFTNARFSVNEYSTVVTSEIDLFNNITVSVLRSGTEQELPGLRAIIPAYSIGKNFLNQNVLTILGDALVGDQIVVRTLGLNHRRIRERQFVWGNTSNILKTQLPPPINLDQVSIVAVPLPLTSIGPSNSTVVTGQFHTTLTTATQPTNMTEGRLLSIRITGGNVDFTSPVTVTINGTTAAGPTSETIGFSSAATQTTANKFKTISSVMVVATPIVTTANSISIEIKEANPITISEGNNIYPVIRFSYKTQIGTSLSGTGSETVQDTNGFFVESNINQQLVITSPPTVAGTYTIVSRVDSTTITVSPTPAASFTNATYAIYNVSLGRSGFQNGFFTLERAGGVNIPFPLSQGVYEFDFSTYLEIPFDSVSGMKAYVGSDYNGLNSAKAVLDEVRILSKKLTDVRVGETLATGADSITTDFNKLRQFSPDSNTLMLLHFNSLPLINSADYWITSEKEFLQSGESVNDNFGQSLVVTNRPLVVDNAGLFSTNSEGSIEFWASPRFDTYNDPNVRMYFDATGSVVEEIVSTTNGIVKVNGNISNVISVRLASDVTSTGTDFFANGTIASDFKTILLQKSLPFQQTPVRVNYIPSGLSGNRISIYKDQEGFITLNVKSNDGLDYQIRQPIFWSRDSWHRVLATYKFNRADNNDEIRLFVDGEERGVITFGSGLLFSTNITFGQGFSAVTDTQLIADINFNDPINQFFIGSDYLRSNIAEARIDNLRLSNTARKPISIGGQPKDVNYSSNQSIVFPVVEDAFTTYLLNFDSLIRKADDFALLKNQEFGISDFTLNIIDSFGIVSGNAKIKQILESLIAALKPAQSRTTINYIDSGA